MQEAKTLSIIVLAEVVLALIVQRVYPMHYDISLGWWMIAPLFIGMAFVFAAFTLATNGIGSEEGERPREPASEHLIRIALGTLLCGSYGMCVAPFIGLMATPVYFVLTGNVNSSLFLGGLSLATCALCLHLSHIRSSAGVKREVR